MIIPSVIPGTEKMLIQIPAFIHELYGFLGAYFLALLVSNYK